jgi:hypothetical protein
MSDRIPNVWWSQSHDGVFIRSLHGGYKKVATGYGYAWSSDGVDGYRDALPDDAVLLVPEEG